MTYQIDPLDDWRAERGARCLFDLGNGEVRAPGAAGLVNAWRD